MTYQQAPLIRLTADSATASGSSTLAPGTTLGLDPGSTVELIDELILEPAQIAGGIGALYATRRVPLLCESFRSAIRGIGQIPEQWLNMYWDIRTGASQSVSGGLMTLGTTAANQVLVSMDSCLVHMPLDTMILEARSVWRAATGPAAGNRMEFGFRDENPNHAPWSRDQWVAFSRESTGLYCWIYQNGADVYRQAVSSPVVGSDFAEYVIRMSKQSVEWFIRTATALTRVGSFTMLGTGTTLLPGPGGLRAYVQCGNPVAAGGSSSMFVSSVSTALLGNTQGMAGRRIKVSSLSDILLVDGPGILETVDVVATGTPQTWTLYDANLDNFAAGYGLPILLSTGLVAGREMRPRAYFGQGLYFDHSAGAAAATLMLSIRS